MTFFSLPLLVSNTLLSFHFVRSFIHLFVLFSLLVHQLTYRSFIDPHLSINVYLLCFSVLFIDSLYLFFYKENEKALLQNLFLLFIDALFLSGLVMVMGPSGLFLVFVFVFFQSFLLFLAGQIFQVSVFLLSLSVLLPITFLWSGNFSFEDRFSLVILIHVALFFVFFFNWSFNFILKFFEDKKTLTSEDSLNLIKPASHIGMSLDLARKLKPVLNSLIKYFPENKEDERSASSGLFSPKQGRHQLEQMRSFILSFIKYAEPETESLLRNTIDLKKLLTHLLKQSEEHPQRPENLIQKLELPVEFKIKGSADHLKKCFEHILINSFEALKNQDKPEINIHGFLEKSSLVLEFLDNGHGIESENIKRLFDPLFSQKFGLRGLGLAYVQKVIKAHKALLDITSSKKGTKVSIKFPLIDHFHDNYFVKQKTRKKVA